MKKSLLLALSMLAASTAFAQAPAGTLARPSAQANPTAAGGAPATEAQMKVDAKKDGMTMGASGSGMGMKAMDANGDGMISKKEYDRYHSTMWNSMKPSKGMVSMADMESKMKGGPN